MRPPRKPAPVPSNTDESRRTNVLLEALRKKFHAFGEGLAAARRKLGSVKAAVGDLDADMRLVKDEFKSMANVLRAHGEDLKVLRYTTGESSRELEHVKTELRLIRGDLNAYAKRLADVEARLAA